MFKHAFNTMIPRSQSWIYSLCGGNSASINTRLMCMVASALSRRFAIRRSLMATKWPNTSSSSSSCIASMFIGLTNVSAIDFKQRVVSASSCLRCRALRLLGPSFLDVVSFGDTSRDSLAACSSALSLCPSRSCGCVSLTCNKTLFHDFRCHNHQTIG